LLKIFRGTGPGVIVLIMMTMILLWLPPIIRPDALSACRFESQPMPLYNIIKSLIGSNSHSGVIFSFIILIFLIFLLVNFNTSVFFIGERTFLPAIIYVLFSALLSSLQVLNPVLPAAIFLMLALKRIMESYRKSGTAYNFFDAAILISTGSLFYANLIWFGILVFVGIALLRAGNLIEILTSLLGLITPYAILMGIYYVIERDPLSLLTVLGSNLFDDCPGLSLSRMELAVFTFSGIMLLFGTVFLLRQINIRKIKKRKTFFLLLWCLLITLILYFSLPSASGELLWIIMIPVSYILSNYFIFMKKKLVTEIFFSGLFLLIIVLQAFRLF